MNRIRQCARKATGLPPPPRRRRLDHDSDPEDDTDDSDPEAQEEENDENGTAYERLTMENLLRRVLWVPMTGGSHGLTKEFLFSSFGEAWAYMNRLALQCERRQFYPKLTVQSTTVTVVLGHEEGEAGGLTRKGFEFARFADSAAEPLAIG